MIIYVMLNHIPIHWPNIILDTMLKAKRLPQYPLSYSLLISRICEYKGVNVSDEQSHNTTEANKIAENSLKQMKFIPFGNTYIHKDDMPPSDHEEEENPPTAPIPPVDTNIGASSGVGGSSSSLEDHILNLNQRLEEFFLLSTHRHEEVTGIIRRLDSRISNLEHFKEVTGLILGLNSPPSWFLSKRLNIPLRDTNRILGFRFLYANKIIWLGGIITKACS